VIPVYNDERGLKDTIKSLVVQDYPFQDFEIIICDNGSKDNTFDVAKEYAKKFSGIIKVVVEDKIQSSYAARNKGIKVASGSIIAFIDADMTVEKDYVKSIASLFGKNGEISYMGTNVEIYLQDNNIFGTYNKITGFPIEKYITISHFAPTCCLIARKDLFKKIGLFDYRLISGGDFEFGNRAYKNGYKLYFEPRIIVKHPARSGFKKCFSKHFHIGRGHQQLAFYYSAYKSRYRMRVFNPYNYLPGKPWKLYRSIRKSSALLKLSLLNIICLYFIQWLAKLADRMGYFYENFRKKRFIY
jgi:glycosyltransferase AglI